MIASAGQGATRPGGTSRLAVEVLLILGVTAIGVVSLVFDVGEGGSDASAISYLLVLAAGLALFGRNRWPLVVLGLVALARVVLSVESGGETALVAAMALALFTVARTGDRRRHLTIAVAIAVVVAVTVAAIVARLGQDHFVHELAGELAILLLPVAIGDAARSRADRLDARIEAEAEARVQAERLRIARDLHDVVAHGLSTIAVQSGVAAHLIDRDVDQAREALEIINQTGRTSLEELRSMVGVLRSTDDTPLRPTPSDPDDLAELLAWAVAAGIPITTTIDGSFPPDASDRCVVAVHRIIQESLTNVVRHAEGAGTDLSISHGVEAVVVTITNEAGGRPSGQRASTGVGLVGMAERAESLGGTLAAGPLDDGGFRVTATVPYQRHVAGDRSP